MKTTNCTNETNILRPRSRMNTNGIIRVNLDACILNSQLNS